MIAGYAKLPTQTTIPKPIPNKDLNQKTTQTPGQTTTQKTTQSNYKYIAPWVYDGTCDTIVFNTWLTEILIPQVKLLKIAYPQNPVALVLDNVAYHKSQETLDLCNNNGIYLVFQSAYSPDLDPIEPSWDTTKNDIRSQSYLPMTFQDKLFNSLNKRSWNGD